MTEPLRLVPGLALGPAPCASAPISSSPSYRLLNRLLGRLLRCRLYRLFFLRAGAAFFFAAVRFFVFAFFAMIVLPIQAGNVEPVALSQGDRHCATRRTSPLLTSLPWTGASPPPADVPEARADMVPPVAQSSSSTVWTTGMCRARGDLRDAADIAGRDHIGPQSSRYSRPCARATSSRSPAAECCRCRPSRSTDGPPARPRR